MALKTPKTVLQSDVATETTNTPSPITAFPDAQNIEGMIADQLLQDLDWAKVRAALIDRARQKFWVWLSSQLLPVEQNRIALTEIDAIAIGSSEVES